MTITTAPDAQDLDTPTGSLPWSEMCLNELDDEEALPKPATITQPAPPTMEQEPVQDTQSRTYWPHWLLAGIPFALGIWFPSALFHRAPDVLTQTFFGVAELILWSGLLFVISIAVDWPHRAFMSDLPKEQLYRFEQIGPQEYHMVPSNDM